MKNRENEKILAPILFILMIMSLSSGCLTQKEESDIQQTESPPPSVEVYLLEWANLQNDQGPVYSQDWSPREPLLAISGFSQVKLWRAEPTPTEQVLEGHTSYVWGVAFSPDGNTLATASRDGTVRLWKGPTFEESAVLETGFAFCVSWAPDSAMVAVGTLSGEIQAWDAGSEKLVHMWRSHSSSMIISIVWAPDGKTIVTGELEGGIYVWDAETFTLQKSMTDYSIERRDVNGLAFSPDGKTLASAHQDGKIRLWDTRDWNLLNTINAHYGWVRGVAWSPDGRMLASSGEDKRACLWDPETGKRLIDKVHNFLPVWSVAWSEDGGYFSSGSGIYNDLKSGWVIVWKVQ
ncbi:MAG: WD40 repeat domain-containing protein [Theionarchaea archaeon]|nr:WD40 repeat domain-containing protein [Theionarchaea archaeon]